MRIKIAYYFFLFSMLFSCMSNPEEPYLRGAQFNPGTRVLTVDYGQSPDSALRRIILYSGVRKSGYGVIVNVDSALSTTAISGLKEQFKKLDINAVHDYAVNSREGADILALTAIKGARFTWVFSGDSNWMKNPSLTPLGKSIETSLQSGGISVVQ